MGGWDEMELDYLPKWALGQVFFSDFRVLAG